MAPFQGIAAWLTRRTRRTIPLETEAQLQLIRLEDRRVLQGMPIAAPAAAAHQPSPTSPANTYLISRHGNEIDVSLGGVLVQQQSVDQGRLTIDALVSGAQFIVNMSGGNPIPKAGLTLVGPNSGTASLLIESNGALAPFTSVTYSLLAGNQGSISLATTAANGSTQTSTINFSNVDAIEDDTAADSRVLELDGGPEQLTLAAATAGGQPALVLASSLGQTVTFADPTQSLTIQDTSQPADSLVLATFDLSASLAIEMAGGITLAGQVQTGGLSISADSIGLNSTLNAGPSMQLVAQDEIIVASSAMLVAQSNIDLEAPNIQQAGDLRLLGPGLVRLDAGSQGTVVVSGRIDASDLGPTGTGGTVQVLGNLVGLTDDAVIDVSGSVGGSVVIGGDEHDLALGPLASRTYIGPEASIIASSDADGNGGSVVVWSSQLTAFEGMIAAQGGPTGGNGGSVEVSSVGAIDFEGQVDSSAPNGNPGSLLLDPTTIEILDQLPVNLTGFNPPTSLTEAFTDDVGLVTIIDAAQNSTGSFWNVSNGQTITLQATEDIDVEAALDLQAATNGAQNVNLTLQAGNDIVVGAAITSYGTGSITLSANDNGGPASGAGQVQILAPISAGVASNGSSGGNLTISGSQVIASGDLSATGSINVSATAAVPLDLSAITVSSSAASPSAVTIENGGSILLGTISATSGGVVLGVTGASGDISQGLNVQGLSTTITADSLSADGPGGVDLTDSGNSIGSLGTVSAGNSFQLVDSTSSGLSLSGSISASSISITNQNSLVTEDAGMMATGSGGIDISGLGFSLDDRATITAGSSSVVIDGGGATIGLAGGILSDVTGTAVTLQDATTVQLGKIVDASGILSLSTTSDVTQNVNGSLTLGGVSGTVGGQLLLTPSGAGSNAIGGLGDLTVTDALTLNDTGALVISGPVNGNSSSGSITLGTNGLLTVDGNITTIDGAAISLTADGIQQSNGSTVNAAGQLSLDGGGSTDSIILAGELMSAASGQAVIVQDALSIQLGNVSATSGTVVLGESSNVGSVSQSAGTAIDASALEASVSSNLALTQSNAIDNLDQLGVGGIFQLVDSVLQLSINDSFTAGSVNIDNQNLDGSIDDIASRIVAAGGISFTGVGITLEAGTQLEATANPITLNGGTGVVSVSGVVQSTGNGTISVSGSGISQSAASTIDAGSGTIALAGSALGSIGLAGTLETTSASNTAITIDGATDITLGNILATSGTLALGQITSVASVLQTAGTSVQVGTFVATASDGITLTPSGATNSITSLGGISAGGAFDLMDAATALSVGGPISAASVNITNTGSISTTANVTSSAGNISLSGAGITQTAGTLDAGADSITLDGNSAAVTLSGTLKTTGSAVTINNATSLSLGTVTASGATLSLDASGAISQSAGSGLNVASIEGSGGTILLNPTAGATNDITSIGQLTASGPLQVTDNRALEVDGPVSTTAANSDVALLVNGAGLSLVGNITTADGSNIDLTATGITQSLASTLNSGTGAITLDGNGAAVTLAGTLETTGSAITINNATSLTLGTVTASGATLSLAASGTISQSAASGLNVASVQGSGGSILLNPTAGATNQIGSIGQLTASGPLQVTDNRALEVDGPVSTTAANSDVALLVNGAGLSLVGNITTADGSNIQLTAAGISQSAASTIDAGSGTIALAGSALGSIGLAGTLETTSASSNAITIDGATSVTLGNVVATSGTLALGQITAVSSVLQTAGTSVQVGTFVATAADGIALAPSSATNSITSLGGISAGAAFDLMDAAAALSVGGPISAASVSITNTGSISTTANVTSSAGNISLSGAGITQTAGTLDAGADSITLDGNSAAVTLSGTLKTTGSAVTINNATSLSLGTVTASGATLSLAASGTISQSAASGLNVASVQGSGGSILLNPTAGATNQIGSIGQLTASGPLQVTDNRALEVDGPISTTAANSDVALLVNGAGLSLVGNITTADGSNIQLTAAGITQSAASTIDAGSGTIALTGSALGSIGLAGTLETTSASNTAITIDGATSVTLGNVVATSGTLALGQVTEVLSVSQTAGTSVQVGTFVATATDGIALTPSGATNSITSLGAISAGGAFDLMDTAAALSVGGPISAASVSITNTGSISTTANVTSSAGTISVSGAGITQTAGTLDAGADSITLDGNGAAVTLSGTLKTTGSAITINNATSLTLGTVTALGATLSLDASGAISQSGGTGLNVASVQGSGGSILLNPTASATNQIISIGQLTASGPLQVTDNRALEVDGPVSTTAANSDVILLVNGAGLSLVGNITTADGSNIQLTAAGITQSAASTIDAGSGTIALTGSALGSIGLAGTLETTSASSNAITIDGATSVTLGNVVATSGTLALGQITAVASVLQTAGTSVQVGTFVATATDGIALTPSGATNSITSLGAISAGAAFDLMDTAAALSVGGPISAASVSITNTGSISTTANVTSSAGTISVSGAGITQTAGTLDAGADSITLDGNGAAVTLSGTLKTTGSAVTINNATSLSLGTVTAPGATLSLDASGTILQSAASGLNVASVQGSGGSILLNPTASATNQITSIGQLTASGPLQVTDNRALEVDGPVSTTAANSDVILLVNGAGLSLVGNITTTDGSNIQLAAAGITQSAASTLDSGTGTITLDGGGAAIGLLGTLQTSSSSAGITIHDASTVGLGAVSAAGSSVILGLGQDITGTVTQTGSISAGTLELSGAGAFTLNNAANQIGALSGTATSSVSLADNEQLQLGQLSTQANLSLLISGAISQTAALTVEGSSSFSSGANPITLNLANDLVGPVTLDNSGNFDISLNDITALNLAASNVGSGNLVLSAAGSITQTGAITQAAGAASAQFIVNTPGADVLLTKANDFTAAVAVSGGGGVGSVRDLTLVNTDPAAQLASIPIALRNLTLTFANAAVTLPSLDLTGQLQVSAGGNITQSAPITVAGVSQFSTGAFAINLDQPLNGFLGAVSLANSGANDVTIDSQGLLTLGSSTIGSGLLSILATGIEQTGPIVQAPAALGATFNAGLGPIDLSSAGNVFSGPVALENSGIGNVTLDDSQALLLAASSVGSGSLTITAAGISQTGALTQAPLAGPASFNAGNASLLLNQPGNLLTGLVSLNNSGPGNVTLINGAPLELIQAATGSGLLEIQSTGTLTIGQLPGPYAAITTAGGIDLSTLASGDIAVDQGIQSVSGGVTLASAGAISMASGTQVNAGSGALTLSAAGNIGIAALQTSNSTASAVSITSTGGQVAAAGHAQPNVSASGGLNIAAATGIGSGDPLQVSVGSLSAQNSLAGDIDISALSSIAILNAVEQSGGNIALTANGTMTIGSLTGVNAAVSTVGSGGITLSTDAASNLLIQQSVQAVDGAINLNAGGLTLAGTAAASTVGGNISVVAGSVAMAAGTSFSSTSGTIGLSATGNISLARLATGTTVSVNSSSGSIAAVNQAGNANIVAGEAALIAAAGIGSSSALTTSVGTLAASNSTSGGINLANLGTSPFTIGTVAALSGIQLSGTAPAAVTVATVGPMTVAGNVLNTSGGNISLSTGGGNTLSTLGRIVSSGGNGNITLTAGGNLVLNDTVNQAIANPALWTPDIQVSGSGMIMGNAGGQVQFGNNVLVQSGTGAVTGTPPLIASVQTPEINSNGIATVTVAYGRADERNFTITVNWNDGTTSTVQETSPGVVSLTHSYLTNPDLANGSAPIPISITVSGDPNISFSGKTVVVSTAPVSGLGLFLAYQVLSVPVQQVIFVFPRIEERPQQPVEVVPLTSMIEVAEPTVQPIPTEQRVVTLNLVPPGGGKPVPFELPENVVDNLPALFQRLPDGHYQIYVSEPGRQPRMLIDVYLRQGRPVDPDDKSEGTEDRPPTAMLGTPAAEIVVLPTDDVNGHAAHSGDSTAVVAGTAVAAMVVLGTAGGEPGESRRASAADAMLARASRQAFNLAGRLARRVRRAAQTMSSANREL